MIICLSQLINKNDDCATAIKLQSAASQNMVDQVKPYLHVAGLHNNLMKDRQAKIDIMDSNFHGMHYHGDHNICLKCFEGCMLWI